MSYVIAPPQLGEGSEEAPQLRLKVSGLRQTLVLEIVGTVGGVVSTQAAVTVVEVELNPVFPATSVAKTVTEYVPDPTAVQVLEVIVPTPLGHPAQADPL
jgi:hypothetical protein